MKLLEPSPNGANATLRDPRWKLVAARSASADGQFVYAVRSTGIYCRPSCGARLARPENVRFYDSCEAAQRAGFRACLRCKPQLAMPDARLQAAIVAACRAIDSAQSMPALDSHARDAGLSEARFRRAFKQATGLAPAAWFRGGREERMRALLAAGGKISNAIYEAGYESNSRFYEHAPAVLGMTPSAYRAAGAGEEIGFSIRSCALGKVLVAVSERGICAILLGDSDVELKNELRERFAKAELKAGDDNCLRMTAQVAAFVDAPGAGLDLPLDLRGTAFQRRVWEALRTIPAGETTSYARLAQALGMPRGARAVASACAANALAVAVPCHRVVAADGSLSGYRWKVERKRALLENEAAGLKGKKKTRGSSR